MGPQATTDLRVGFAAVRVLLVVNPAASSVSSHTRAAVERILRAAFALDVVETTRRGHATELARDAVGNGYDVVAVLAGDGTLNEAGGGLAGSTVALAPLPGGSTNVFARTLGIAYDPEDAARELVESLQHGRMRRIGLGAATAAGTAARHFLFHLGVGFDAAIIRRMEARSYLKRYLAHPAFAVATIDTWLRYYDRRTAIRLTSNMDGGGQVVATGPYAVISNSDPYTYVGRRRMTIAPSASLDDALTVTVLTDLRAGLILRTAASSVGSARYLGASPRIVQVADAVAVSLTGDCPFPWQVDGDYLGEVEHLDVAYLSDCLTIVTPT
jgi:diacylglycerol kinase family enzyme